MIKLKSLIVEAVTDSPNFKKWFGNSKVVDNTGNPLVVYHVSKENPSKFKDEYRTDLSSMGFHFGTKEQAKFRSTQYDFSAGKGSSTIPVYLSIRNPLEVSHMASFAPDHLAEQMMDLGFITDDDYGKIRDAHFEDKDVGKQLVVILKKRGYDGLKYSNEREGEGYSYVPFSSTQIKSAMANNGNFNSSDADITKQ